MKRIKFLALIAVITCCMLQAFQVFAYTNETKNINASEVSLATIVKPFGDKIPTAITSWDDNKIYYKGQADNTTLYSEGLFTNASNVGLEITNNHESEDLKVILYKKNKITSTWVDERIYSPGKTAKNQFSSNTLDSSAKYYFKFRSPSDFEGTLTRKEK